MTRAMLGLALAVRFALELCLVAVASWFPWHVWRGVRAAVGTVVLVGLVMLVWGYFLSPKRRWEIGGLARLVLEVGLFCLASATLLWAGRWQLAIALLATALADKLVLVVLEGHL